MEWQIPRAEWRDYEGMVRERWAALTDEEFDEIDGDRERLVRTIEQRYGVSREEAEQDVREFLETLDRPAD